MQSDQHVSSSDQQLHTLSCLISTKAEYSVPIDEHLTTLDGYDASLTIREPHKTVAVFQHHSLKKISNNLDDLAKMPEVCDVNIVFHHTETEESLNMDLNYEN